jgi:predicted phage terminase large subunit-like protein
VKRNATGQIWTDPRKEGEPLWPERFSWLRCRMAKDEGMSSHMAAGQYQQRPTAREGGLFKREWFDNPLAYISAYERLQLVRAWDIASVAEQTTDPDYTVGVKMGKDKLTNMLYVLDVIRGRWSPAEVERKVYSTAVLDGPECRVRIPQDPGAAGRFAAHHLVTLLQGYSVATEREEGNKEYRADPFAAQCEHGLVKLVEAAWNRAFVEELCAFPNGAHDDQVDAASAAFRALMRRVTYHAVAA